VRVLLVGLTGGIGAGKSTFAALLAERGAQIVDADALGRAALAPGKPAWHGVVSQFGDEVLVPGSMEVDRARLAEVVFNDRGKLAALNAIVHPVILAGVADRLEELRDTDEIVVLDAALIVDMGLAGDLDVLIVVVAKEDERYARLLRGRGMTRDQVAARMASQTNEATLVESADIVIHNDGSLENLATEADKVWAELVARAEVIDNQ
jgi:dephospho-CoA kinase